MIEQNELEISVDYKKDNRRYNQYEQFLQSAHQSKSSIEKQIITVDNDITICNQLLTLFDEKPTHPQQKIENTDIVIAKTLATQLFNSKPILTEPRQIPFDAIDKLFKEQTSPTESTDNKHEAFYNFLGLTEENKKSDLYTGSSSTSFYMVYSRIKEKHNKLQTEKEQLSENLIGEKKRIERLTNDKKRVEEILQELESFYIQALSKINTYLEKDNWKDEANYSKQIIELINLLDRFFEIQKKLPWGQENATNNRFEIEYQKQIKVFNAALNKCHRYLSQTLDNFFTLIEKDLNSSDPSRIIEDLEQFKQLVITKSASPIFTENKYLEKYLENVKNSRILCIQLLKSKIARRVEKAFEITKKYDKDNSSKQLNALSKEMGFLDQDLSLLDKLKETCGDELNEQIKKLKNWFSMDKDNSSDNDNSLSNKLNEPCDNELHKETEVSKNQSSIDKDNSSSNPLNIESTPTPTQQISTPSPFAEFTASFFVKALKILGATLLLIGLLAALGSALALTVPLITAALTTSTLGIAKITLIGGGATMGVGALLLGTGLFKQKAEERECNTKKPSNN